MKQSDALKVCALTVFIIIAGLFDALSLAGQRAAASLRPVVTYYTCTPVAESSAGTVGGLAVAVPRLPQALRLNYGSTGYSQYTVRATGDQVLGYYLPQLALNCWQVAVLQTDSAVWQRGEQAVRVAVANQALGEKTLVSYQAFENGRVLGATVHIAQTSGTSCPAPPSCSGSYTYDANGCLSGCSPTSSTPPSGTTCGSGSYMCNGACIPSTQTCTYTGGSPTSCLSGQLLCPGTSGMSYCYAGTTCPSSTTQPSDSTWPMDQASCTSQSKVWCLPTGGSGSGWCQSTGPCPTSTTTPTPTTCSSGQYLCNNSCVPNGSSCNSYPYYQPGSTMPSCGSTGFFCPSQNKCLPSGSSCDTGNTNQMPTNQSGQPNTGLPPTGTPGFGNNQGDQTSSHVDEQRFEQMKRGLGQFASGIRQMTKMVERLKSQLKGAVGIPPELIAAVAKAPDILNQLKSAQTPSELEQVMGDMQDMGQTMQEWGPKLGELTRLAQMLKQADRDAKNIGRAVSHSQSLAKRNSNLSEVVGDLGSAADQLKSALGDIKTLAQTDPEAALDKLQDDFYGNMEEFWNKASLIETIGNLQNGLKKANLALAQATRAVRQLEKAGTTEAGTLAALQQSLADLKDKLAEVKALAGAKPIDPEALQSAAEDLWQQFADFQNSAADAGASFYLPNVSGGQNIKFQPPQGFGGSTSTEPQPAPQTTP